MSFEVVEHDGRRYAEIIWAGTSVEKSTFFSPAGSSFQFGLLAHEAGFIEPAHYHPPSSARSTTCSRCSWCRRGVVAVEFFTDGGDAVSRSRAPGGRCDHADPRRAFGPRARDNAVRQRQAGSFPRRGSRQSGCEGEAMIPVFEPFIGETEIAYVTDALRRGEISGIFGTLSRPFREGLCRILRMQARRCRDQRHDRAASRGGRGRASARATRCWSAPAPTSRPRSRVIHNNAMPVPVDSEGDDLESGYRPDRSPDHAEDEGDHSRPSVRSSRRHGSPHGDGEAPQFDRHRGLRRVARRHGARTHDRQLRRHVLLQLLRQQGHHHRRGRHGDDQ